MDAKIFPINIIKFIIIIKCCYFIPLHSSLILFVSEILRNCLHSNPELNTLDIPSANNLEGKYSSSVVLGLTKNKPHEQKSIETKPPEQKSIETKPPRHNKGTHHGTSRQKETKEINSYCEE